MKMKGQEKKAVQELTEGTSCISSRVSFATFTPRQKDGKEDSCNYHPESQRVRASTVQEGEINISRKANIIRRIRPIEILFEGTGELSDELGVGGPVEVGEGCVEGITLLTSVFTN